MGTYIYILAKKNSLNTICFSKNNMIWTKTLKTPHLWYSTPKQYDRWMSHMAILRKWYERFAKTCGAVSHYRFPGFRLCHGFLLPFFAFLFFSMWNRGRGGLSFLVSFFLDIWSIFLEYSTHLFRERGSWGEKSGL